MKMSRLSLCEVKLPAMGGEFVYQAYPQSLYTIEEVECLLKEAHDEVLRIEKKFTEFEESIITEINAQAGIAPVSFDEELSFLLQESKKYYDLSKGIFDPTYASYLSRWREKSTPLGFLEKIKLKALVNFKSVEIDFKKKTIMLPFKGQRIGMGGIGKGYAVDRAFEFLKTKGIENFSVNGSGDMRVHSKEDAPRPWNIGIRNPFAKEKEQSAGLVTLQNGSVSTSGSYIQFKDGDSSDHHIVSRYKEKNRHPVSCTIVGEGCLDTDVWATIAMAQDIEDALVLLNKEEKFAILIDRTGQTHLTHKALKHFGQ